MIWNAMSNFKHLGAILFAKDMERHKAHYGKNETGPDPPR
jgi:hypothetical protein